MAEIKLKQCKWRMRKYTFLPHCKQPKIALNG